MFEQVKFSEGVAMVLRVSIEDLVASGVAETNHGENLAMARAAADGRIEPVDQEDR